MQGVKGGQTKVPRSKMQVELRNGTYRSGLGTQVAAALEQRGLPHHQDRRHAAQAVPRRRRSLLGRTARPACPTLTKDLLASNAEAGPGQRRPAGWCWCIGDDWKGLKPLAPTTPRR